MCVSEKVLTMLIEEKAEISEESAIKEFESDPSYRRSKYLPKRFHHKRIRFL